MTDGVKLLRRRIVRSSRHDRREAERAAVRELLREAFGADVNLLHNTCGRPSIEGFPHFISLSHSRDEAVVAVSREVPVGIDVESWREALLSTAHKWLTPDELAQMHTPLDYLKAWTAKEAIFKAMPAQPSGLIDIPLPYLGGSSGYTVSWEGTLDSLLAVAIQDNILISSV